MKIRATLSLVACVLSVILAGGMALAGDGRDDSGTGGAAAEVKIARDIQNREPVDEGTSFTAGERVWAWSRITGANDTTVKHVWKRDGKVERTIDLDVKSARWTTYSRHKLRAGQYVVEVQSDSGAILGSASFTVQ